MCLLFVLSLDVCVSTEVEDLAVSIDIQEVYSKVECKLGSANVVHYIKRWVLARSIDDTT